MAIVTLTGANGSYLFNPLDPSTRLGAGGMGVVFKGTQVETERPVAIKVLYRDLTENISNIERLKRSSEIRIQHPNLIEMLDFVELNGIYHDISAFVEGQDLSDHMASLKAENKTVPAQEALHIVNEVLNGLEVLHQQQIIHRDIDPSNIRLCPDGVIKLMDFGIVRLTDGKTKSLTGVGTLIGKPNYSPPEQIRGESANINFTSDLYALGITLYEMLTGAPPFEKGNEFSTMQAQVRDPLPPHRLIPPSVFPVLQKVTRKEQARRYQSVAEFRQALNNPKPPAPWERKRTRVQLAVGLGVLLLLIVGGSWLFRKYNAYTNHLEQAQLYYHTARYDSAAYHYQQALALFGNDSATRQLNRLNFLSKGLDRYYRADYRGAFQFMTEAAQLGSADGHYFLGELYANGYGVRRDYARSLEHAKKSAALGFEMANYRLGLLYEDGLSVRKDAKRSTQCYEKSLASMQERATNGEPEAQANLSDLYGRGKTVTQNTQLALDWLQKAVDKGFAMAKVKMGDTYYNGLRDKNGRVLLAANARKAFFWYERAAVAGEPSAMTDLGAMYLYGYGGWKNVGLGLQWLEKAMSQQFGRAYNVHGDFFRQRNGSSADAMAAVRSYQMGIQFDSYNWYAMNRLATCFRDGYGVLPNGNQVRQLYEQMTKQFPDNGYGYYMLSDLYLTGSAGLSPDPAQAFTNVKKSADLGYADGLNRLGVFYYKGSGTSVNVPQACACFKKAVALGHQQARNNLLILQQQGVNCP